LPDQAPAAGRGRGHGLQAFPPESAWAPQKDRPPTGQSHIGRPENVITVQEHRSRRSGAVGAAAGQSQTHRAPASPRAVLIHRTRSNTMTLRRLSALRIFLFGGLSPVRTILIIEGATPFFFAHSFWLPARFTSERSNRITSFWSNARMVCFRTAAFRWRPRRSAHTLLHFPAHWSPAMRAFLTHRCSLNDKYGSLTDEEAPPKCLGNRTIRRDSGRAIFLFWWIRRWD
jgi:hypothetical protein